MTDANCHFCYEIVKQNYVTKIFCDHKCNRMHIYFIERLKGIKAPRQMQPEFSTDEMKQYIQYCIKMMEKREPALFYNYFAKYLKTKSLPEDVLYYVKNMIPLPRPKSSELIQLQVVNN